MNKTCIIIAGPTASGKTSIALEIARKYSTSIISADSRQCYRELNIGVAKPSDEELKSIRHYFLNSHSIHQHVSAADFEKYALQATEEIFIKNDIAVMAGGTGLYIKTFCEGLDFIEQADDSVRISIIKNYKLKGIEWLQKEIKIQDPVFYMQGEIHNPRRLMRALEVKLTTGTSITAFQSRIKKLRNFKIIKIGLELPRENLYQRINQRVDKMMLNGLLNEARVLIEYSHLPALQTVGYKELFSYLDGEISYENAVDLMKKNTRHYAKRQLTWFKKDQEINWFPPGEVQKIHCLCGERINPL